MSFEIREARLADTESILDLIKELAVYEKAENEVDVTLDELERDLFGRDKIIDAQVAISNNRVVGTAIYYTKYSTWKGKCLYLEDIVVTQSFRGKGIGKDLFRKVVEIAKQRNSGRMEWQVLDWNEPAIKFYNSFNAILDDEWINCKFTKKQLQEGEIL